MKSSGKCALIQRPNVSRCFPSCTFGFYSLEKRNTRLLSSKRCKRKNRKPPNRKGPHANAGPHLKRREPPEKIQSTRRLDQHRHQIHRSFSFFRLLNLSELSVGRFSTSADSSLSTRVRCRVSHALKQDALEFWLFSVLASQLWCAVL